jgi:uncharacterized protein YbbC (DUF1343 family)
MNLMKVALCVFGALVPVPLSPVFAAPHDTVLTSERVEVLPGIDVLQGRGFDILQGKRVGLVTNQTGQNRAGVATIDILRRASGVKLMALFSPEHGVRGQVAAGAHVSSSRDQATGLPVYSLYGKTLQPTSAMLKGVQTLVFDMQSIGSRSYTFLATLEKCRLACAANNINLVVLDRPNPLGGAMEGNIPQNYSFVCPFPIPYRTGLTLGETARWLNARASKKCQLTVVPVQNYRRQPFSETGLTWTRTSPNIPRATSAYFYQATGLLGELPALSIGIGTSTPFELAGAPGVNAHALAARLNARRLPGWSFRAATWTPTKGRHARERCQGVQILLTNPQIAQTTRLNFEIYSAVRQVDPQLAFFSSTRNNAMFDMVCGTKEIRRLMQQGQSADTIWSVWNRGAATFAKQSAPFRLYG